MKAKKIYFSNVLFQNFRYPEKARNSSKRNAFVDCVYIAEDRSMDRRKMAQWRRRHMTLCARSLCFPIILRVFDTATCYVNTSTETRPIDLRRNGLRGRVAAFRDRERERTLSTWQPFSESSTREPTSVYLHCSLDYLPRISIPPISLPSLFHPFPLYDYNLPKKIRT